MAGDLGSAEVEDKRRGPHTASVRDRAV